MFHRGCHSLSTFYSLHRNTLNLFKSQQLLSATNARIKESHTEARLLAFKASHIKRVIYWHLKCENSSEKTYVLSCHWLCVLISYLDA